MTLHVLSPDCRDGNHHKCNGVAWSLLLDSPTECTCTDPSHDEVHA